ncbi:MAG: TonB family protein [Bacteroidales bacterium]|nr:TonB family protein [Bacteroidales bacterium]
MAKGINTNSKEWCDLVFEGRNKRYGAYLNRLKSTKRHILAFVIVILSFAFMAAVPTLIEMIRFYLFQHTDTDYIVEDYKYITESLTEVELMQLSKQFIPKPSLAQTKPTITEDQVPTAEKLKLSTPVIVDESLVETSIPEDLLPDSVISKPKTKDREIFETDTDDGLYVIVEEMPAFPGGEKGLMEYIYRNLRYPYVATSNKIENCVICTFIINTDGSVTQINITQPVHPLLEKEAIRVLKTLPKWIPAKRHGKPIRVKYTLPIIFRLK